MMPDRVLNPGPLTYESVALPIALRGPAFSVELPLLIMIFPEGLWKQIHTMAFLAPQLSVIRTTTRLDYAKWAFGAKMTSYRRRCDVITSHRR